MAGFSMVDDKEYTDEELREKIKKADRMLTNLPNFPHDPDCKSLKNITNIPCNCRAKKIREEIQAAQKELSLE